MIVLSNVAVPTDGVRLIQGQVTAYIENESAGEGELTISESSVTWISSVSGQGFSLTYPSIILHAISRDPSVFHEECIYVLADAKESVNNSCLMLLFADIGIQSAEESMTSARHVIGSGSEERVENGFGDCIDDDDDIGGNENIDGDDDDKVHLAIRFAPQDKTILQNIYQQMCECQGLNPDEGDDFSDDFTMDPDDLTENKSDEDDYEGNGGGGDRSTLYFQNTSSNMYRHETNGALILRIADQGDASGSEQMDEG
uniref:Methylosome subunit pICln n=1 Tax=Elaeophora elaphi TaxID=1147741 RepID=A0A0R3S6I4_9BILA